MNKFGWENDTCVILDILSDQYDPNRNEIHKFLLEHDGEFNLPLLTECFKTYITLDSCVAQDDAMLYNCIISSLS